MAQYEFLTSWCVDAPIERVFAVLNDSAAFPEWWKGVTAVEVLEPGEADGVGELARYSWRSVLPYTLRFDSRVTRVEPPHLIEGHATGELEGIGVWRLFAAPDSTAVLYAWRVRTTKRWMNIWGPVARPAFRWNHDRVMHQGGVGLAERLGASLLLHD
ncbi:MAG TPA: SRPBCC family protein [Rhodothermales bacterium]|nr:SRPBCC family protein [Rhodothermales bacterium]